MREGTGVRKPHTPPPRLALGVLEAAEAQVWEAAGIKPITLHEARHSFASTLIAAGVDPKQVQTYMGHASIDTTFRIYAHLFTDARDDAPRRVDAFLAAQKPPTGALRAVD